MKLGFQKNLDGESGGTVLALQLGVPGARLIGRDGYAADAVCAIYPKSGNTPKPPISASIRLHTA
jgi:hypothetical protein